MKTLLIVLAGCAVLSCNPAKETPQLIGAYSQLSQSVKGNGIDTTTVDRQLKIYTPDYMMYAYLSSDDSVSAFGIGTYSTGPGIINENVFFTAQDTTYNATLRDYTLEIEKTESGFKQMIQGERQANTLSTEEYERVGTEQTTPLDGAWELTSNVSIVKGDTIKQQVTAYKVYYAGNFMFGHTYQDSTKTHHAGIGYGTFEYVGSSKVKESIKTSSYKGLIGKTLDLAIISNGPNEFTQTIVFENGVTEIEVYKRMRR